MNQGQSQSMILPFISRTNIASLIKIFTSDIRLVHSKSNVHNMSLNNKLS